MELPVRKGPNSPVFVVGMNGSGTSMLTESLGRHSKLYAFPGETRMIPHFMEIIEKYGDLNKDDNFLSLWRYIVSSAPDFEIFNQGRIPDIPTNWRDFPRSLDSILDAVYRQFAAATGKQRWCEKSPNNSEHIVAISNLFPHSRFVHIIRDGRDCAASVNRRQHRNSELAIYRWRQVVAEARRQGTKISNRYFEVKYEELTQEPSYWMKKICHFLDLEFEPAILSSSMPQSARRRSQANTGKIEPNSKKYLTYYSEKQLRKLELISGHYLEELGYTIHYKADSQDLRVVRQKAVRALDFVRSNRRLRDKLAGTRDITWGYVLRGILASIREYSAKRH